MRIRHTLTEETSLPHVDHTGACKALPAICYHDGSLFGLFFNSENGSDMFLRNAGLTFKELHGDISQTARTLFTGHVSLDGKCYRITYKWWFGFDVQGIGPHIRTVIKSKVIPVTGHGGPLGCEMLRFPHFLDNRLTDGGEVVSITRRPSFSPQKDFWYSILLEAESTPGP
jgi:hypothetical protein